MGRSKETCGWCRFGRIKEGFFIGPKIKVLNNFWGSKGRRIHGGREFNHNAEMQESPREMFGRREKIEEMGNDL